MLRNKGLKNKRITWEVLEGEVKYQSNVDQAIKQIEDHIDNAGNQDYKITFNSPIKEPIFRKGKNHRDNHSAEDIQDEFSYLMNEWED